MLLGPVAGPSETAFGHLFACMSGVKGFENHLELLFMLFRGAHRVHSLVMHDHHETLTPLWTPPR